MKKTVLAVTVLALGLVAGVQAQGRGHASTYWDGCKPSCSWKDNYGNDVNNRAKECNQQNQLITNPSEATNKSSCDNVPNNNSWTCWDMSPWAVSADLSYGFAASRNRTDCGKCYELTFDGQGQYIRNPWWGSINGKKMMIMISNCGNDVGSTQFDLLVPGGGVGQFDSFNWQLGLNNRTGPNTQNGICSVWPSPMDGPLGARCGGLLAGFCGEGTTTNYEGCLETKCNEVFSSANQNCLKQGCLWWAKWLKAASNPTYTAVERPCPQALLDVYRGPTQGPCTGPDYGGTGGTERTLTANVTPAGSGTISRNNATFTSGSIVSGTQVVLTANAGNNYAFSSWSTPLPAGATTSGTNGNILTFNMPNSNTTVTANFQSTTAQSYTLTANVSPTGGGSVRRNNANFTSASIPAGTSVTLTAQANSGYTFASWTGAPAGAAISGNSITFNMPSAATTVTANFTAEGTGTTYTFTVTAGTGGTVSRNPDRSPVSEGTPVTVTANASNGYIFDNWTAVSGSLPSSESGFNPNSASNTFSITSNVNIRANFKVSAGDIPDNLVRNGTFSNGTQEWGMANVAGGASATMSVAGDKLTINPLTPGGNNWEPQLVQRQISLEQGATYRLTFTAAAVSGTRQMLVLLQQSSGSYSPYSEEKLINLTTTEQSFSLADFTMTETNGDVQLAFNFGGEYGTGGVIISNVQLIKVTGSNATRYSIDPVKAAARTRVTITPTVGGFAALLPANHGYTAFRLINLQGREIRRGNIVPGATDLRFSNLKSGAIFLRLEGSGHTPVVLKAVTY